MVLLILLYPIESFANSVEIENIFLKTYRLFIWQSDYERTGKYDVRETFAHKVKAHEKFYGDCDDFAYTVYDLLTESGYHPQLWIVELPVFSILNPSDRYHMITSVSDSKNLSDRKIWMLDNRYPGLREWKTGVTGSMYKVMGTIPKK